MSRHQDSKAAAEASGRLQGPRSDLFNAAKAMLAQAELVEFPSANFVLARDNLKKAIDDAEFPF